MNKDWIALTEQVKSHAAALKRSREHLAELERSAERLRLKISEQCSHSMFVHVEGLSMGQSHFGKRLTSERLRVPYRRCLHCGLIEMAAECDLNHDVVLLADAEGRLEELKVEFRAMTIEPANVVLPKSTDEWADIMSADIDDLWAMT